MREAYPYVRRAVETIEALLAEPTTLLCDLSSID